jgi:hypothetical protein
MDNIYVSNLLIYYLWKIISRISNQPGRSTSKADGLDQWMSTCLFFDILSSILLNKLQTKYEVTKII